MIKNIKSWMYYRILPISYILNHHRKLAKKVDLLKLSAIPAAAIEINNTCNLNCLICRTQEAKRWKGNIDWNLFVKSVSDFEELGVKKISLQTVGEPLLNQDLIKMIVYLKERNLDVALETNGMLLGGFLKEVLSRKLDNIEIKVSLDGTRKETYEKIRVGANFEKLIANLEELNRVSRLLPRIKVTCHYTVTDDTIDEIPSYWINYRKYFKNGIGISLMSFNSASKGNNAYFHSQRLKSQSAVPCPIVFKGLWVLNDGRVSCCCRDYEGELIVGDIQKESIKDIWEGKRLAEIRALQKKRAIEKMPASCQNCKIVDVVTRNTVDMIMFLLKMGRIRAKDVPRYIRSACFDNR